MAPIFRTAHVGDERGEDLAGQLLLGLELEDIIDRAGRKDHGKGECQHGVADVQARVRHQNGRPAQVPGAQDLNDAGHDEAQKDCCAAHARDGLGVDAAL